MKRIVVVQTAFLGDVVLTTPLLRELRRVHPRASITVVAAPTGADVLAGHPCVTDIERYDKRGAARGVAALWSIARRLREAPIDLAIAAQRSARSALLLLLGGARERIGFAGAPGEWGYTVKVPWRANDHAVRRYLTLAAPAGGDPAGADPRPELAVPPDAADRIGRLLLAHGVATEDALLAVAPGSIWPTKRWRAEGFAEVTRWSAARGLRPVMVGSPGERDLCARVAELAGGRIPVLAGLAGIPDLVALLARSRALVTNDSGAGHVASAVGTPVVVVFGPTVPAFGYAPFGRNHQIVEHPALRCRPCDHHGPSTCPLGHHRCMKEIDSGTVAAALDRVLEGGLARRS